MKKLAGYIITLVLFAVVSLGIEAGTAKSANAEITGSTSMTVVTVRQWITANTEPATFWPPNYGVYNYRLIGKEILWSNNPHPIPFPRDANGVLGGLIWSFYDYNCVSGNGQSTGNKTFIAYAWDFIGNVSNYKDHGGTPPACEDWIGLMYSTIWKDNNRQGRVRSNLTFTTH